MGHRHGITIALLLATCAASSAAASDALPSFERLSIDLRAQRLDESERALVREATLSDRGQALYDQLVDEWLDADAIEHFVGTFLRFPTHMVVEPDAESFFHRLERHGQGEEALYYLPHTTRAAPGEPPCPPDEIVEVEVWWQAEAIRVCADSYRPETVFDEIGYCQGEAEPLMRQAPRSGCGCGPALMGCLPPRGEDPRLDRMVRDGVREEWYESAARLIAEGRPLDELVTTSRTWQSGLIEFLYLRRELLGELRQRPWDPGFDRELLGRIRQLDLSAPGRWVERGGLYEGSGLWWTTMAPHALKIPVRGVAHHLLTRHLGSEFHAVNVDAAAVLAAVGDANENLRTLSSITASPMRTTPGCRGCHAPMDGTAGFLGELQGPMYGSHPTGQQPEGEFFVAGAEDFRGRGRGIAELARLVVEQPEFETVSVRRAFEEVLQRPLAPGDQPLFEELLAEFRANGHRWRPVLLRLLRSEAYRSPGSTNPAAPTGGQVGDAPARVREVIAANCTRCHDQEHYLDLRQLPTSERSWRRILTRVSDFSMPPPDFGEDVTARFPLDPATRSEFTQAVAAMLGPAGNPTLPPRRMPIDAWAGIATGVASGALGPEEVARLASPVTGRVILRKQPPRGFRPPLQVAVERASEDICRAVAQAEGSPYPIPTHRDWPQGERRVAVRELLTRVHGSAPEEADEEAALALLAEMIELTGDNQEAWAGLCSTELSGPRLFFEPYVARVGREAGR